MNTPLHEANKHIGTDDQVEESNLLKDANPSASDLSTELSIENIDNLKEDEVNAANHQPVEHKNMLQTCPMCEKFLANTNWIGKPLNTHTPKPFKGDCTNIPNLFELGEQLKQLSKSHKIVFTCATCKVTFSSRTKFERHIPQAHSGVRPFKCNVCSRTFTLRSNLEDHKKRHMTTREYHCEWCNKSFATARDVKPHSLWKHIRIKLFSCTFCAKAFSSKFNMYRHIRAHIQEKPYTCSKCMTEFCQQGARKNHIRSKH